MSPTGGTEGNILGLPGYCLEVQRSVPQSGPSKRLTLPSQTKVHKAGVKTQIQYDPICLLLL